MGYRGTVPTSSRPAMRKEGRGRLGGGARARPAPEADALVLRVRPWACGSLERLACDSPFPWLGYARASPELDTGSRSSFSQSPASRAACVGGAGSCPCAEVLKGRPLAEWQSQEIAGGSRWAAGLYQVACWRRESQHVPLRLLTNLDTPLFPAGGASPSHLSFCKGNSEGRPLGGPGVDRGHTGQARKM